MTMTPVNAVPVPRFPLSSVTPFTYRDGWTYLEILENFRGWISRELVPVVNENAELMDEAHAAAVAAFEQTLNEFALFKDETGNLVTDIRNAAAVVENIFSELQENGPVVSINGQHGVVTLHEPFEDVRRFGAVGDGITDDTAALREAFGTEGASILLPANRTFRITEPLTFGSNVNIEASGATIDATGIPAGTTIRQRYGIKVDGSLDSSRPIAGAVVKWSRTIDVDTSGLVAGDLVRIRNYENPGPGGSRFNIYRGELNTVARVDSPTQLTLTAGALFDYANDGGLVLAKVNPVENVHIRGLRLIMGGVGSVHTGISFTYARNVTVESTEVIGAEDTGVHLSHVWNGAVRNCIVSGSTSAGSAIGNTGYGVTAEDCSRYLSIAGNRFDNCRSFVNGGGNFPVSNVDVADNHGQGAIIIGYGAHEPCFYWRFSRNTAVGGGGGIQFRGQHGIIENNTLLDMPGNGIRFYAEEGVTAQDDVTVRGNHIERCGNGIVVDGNLSSGTIVPSVKRNVSITDNTVIGSTFDGILLRNFAGATVARNTVRNTGDNGIHAVGLNAETPARDIALTGNQVSGTQKVGIKATHVNDVTISGGSVHSASQQGVFTADCQRVTVSGVSVRGATNNGVRIERGTQHVLTGLNVSDITGASSDAVAIVNANDVTLTGSQLTGNRYGVYSAGGDSIIVSNNNARTSGGGVAESQLRIEGATNYVLNGNLGIPSPLPG